MLRSNKAFVKVTKKGTLSKVVKEHYLRDDILCGLLDCRKCPVGAVLEENPATLSSLILSNDPPRESSLFLNQSHFLIPDTNIFLHQMDVIEQSPRHFTNVIVLQTVLDEMKNSKHPSTLYTRLRSLISNPSRQFYVFCNEHSRSTFVSESESIATNATPNDRNDSAIRKAAAWYSEHLSNNQCTNATVVLLTDDADNREKAKRMSILSCSLNEYISSLPENSELLDMLAESSAAMQAVVENEFVSYEEHMTLNEALKGIESKKLIKGTLSISIYNLWEGSIMAEVDGSFGPVIIPGRSNLNRGLHGDEVVVELFPRSQWKCEGTEGIRISDEEDEEIEKDKGDLFSGTGSVLDDQVEHLLSKNSLEQSSGFNNSSLLRPTGKIVCIFKRNCRQLCGTVLSDSNNGRNALSSQQSVLFQPMDRKYPRVRIRTSQLNQLLQQRIIVTIDGWLESSKYPNGHYVRRVGPVGDRTAETEVLLLEHEVPFTEFTKAVLGCLPGSEWTASSDTDSHSPNRIDLRNLVVCSIDPPGCTDIDDALHCIPLPNGNYQVGVHIADVTHFVKPGTAMDLEAAKRGTTVYLVDRRIDMLPSLLGTNLCSLMSNVDRFAFSCIWELNSEAEIISTHFTKSIIRSQASLTYDQAQDILDSNNSNSSIAESVKNLNFLAKKLKAKRIAAGSLTLASPEVRFSLQNNGESGECGGDPLSVTVKEMKDANSLVEEFMLLANISVAQTIQKAWPECSLLRRHPEPPQDNFEGLKSALSLVGFKLNTKSSKELGDSLDIANIPDSPYFNKLIRIMTTRCMMQAVYFSSGVLPISEYRHYGLAAPIYTHFTSPIRRYADVIVHRLLSATLFGPQEFQQESLLTKNKIAEICEGLNYRHHNAQLASRSSIDLFTCIFFHGKAPETLEAYTMKVLKNGIVVIVPKYGIEGIIPINSKSHPSLTFASELMAFVDESGSVHFQVFQKIIVNVSVDEDSLSHRRRLKITLVTQ